MPMIVSPFFWEWFNIWLVQFLKDLYHEIKMVALRGGSNSINSLSHACVNHGNQSQQSAIDVAQSLQTSLNMPQSAAAQHINANQINLPPLNNVSLQFIPQQNNPSSLKHEQTSSRYSNSNCMLPSHHYRLLTQATQLSYPRASTPHRPECYHPSGATGAAYMPSTAGGAQSSAQVALRVQPAPQPSAPPAPQQDMSKTTMAGHNYVSQPNQTPQARPQYPNFQYRAAQQRPNTHPRQQQPFIPGAPATATGPVMYPTFVLGPTHMGIPPSYQQPRSSNPGYYQYMTPYISYSTPPNHTPPYYYTSNSQQLPTPNLQANAPGGRSNTSNLVGPQGSTATPTAPPATIPQPQAPAHIHQTMPGIRPAQPKRQSHRVPIIDPVTQQDIFSDLFTSDSSQYLSGDSSETHTPQPEQTHSIAEEFTRMVNEVANQPTTSEKSNYVIKNSSSSISSTTCTVQPQPNAIPSINNNTVKSEILTVNESKILGTDIAVESNETPEVSAISDSPVIVPKIPMNIKQLQKNSDQIVQSLVIDKNMPSSKQHKQNKNKPVVPQTEEVEKSTESLASLHGAAAMSAVPAAAPQLTAAAPAPAPAPSVQLAPQPQRLPRERLRSEEKEREKNKDKDIHREKENSARNGPAPSTVISSVDSLQESINLLTSQSNQPTSVEPTKKQGPLKQSSPVETEAPPLIVTKVESVKKSEPISASGPTATQLLEASIEKAASKELPTVPESTSEISEGSAAIQAQAKLTQSLASCIRSNQPEAKMKDINLSNKTTTDPDTANGNTADIAKVETVKEDVNKNEKVVKNTKNSNKKSGNKMNNETNLKEAESVENGKNETDKISNVEQEEDLSKNMAAEEKMSEKAEAPAEPAVAVPKYNYSPDQWSPFNKSGKKCYDLGLLKQMKDDPLSKDKPDVPLLEVCHLMRTAPMLESLQFATFARPMNDSLFPQFAKGSGMGSRNNTPREPKKDGRNMASGGKGSAKLPSAPSSSGPQKPHVIHVSLSLREEVKLNETKDPWKPLRYKKEDITEDDFRTQELYKKFRGILNKLTPQKFDTLIEKIKHLEINNQKRLEGVIDLVFEKAIDEPNFSEAYAAMCNKLSMLKVPADNAASPDQCVNFRALIISKCQNQFVTDKVDENVLKLEKELADCTDPTKKKELQLMLEEENRRVRMRSVGNVRFIGELYKLKMLTAKIMVYCMNYLIDKLEEEKLECLCKLLTTIGEQVESEVKEPLDNVFKKMMDIVDRKSNKISSRVRFMIQDVIELRRRRWVSKSVVDSQPKMMEQIQKEAEQQQRHIELMNATPSGFRRDEGTRGKRGGDGRRQNANNMFMDSNNWKTSRTNYTVDTSKLKAVTQKNLTNIKLAPHNSGWNHGSGTKNTAQAGSNSMISLSKNMYSVLENVQTDPTSLRANKDMSPSYHSKGASIERSTFNSRGDFNSGSGGKSGSMGVAISNSSSRNASAAPAAPAPVPDTPSAAPAPVAQERLPDDKRKIVKSMIELCLINPDDEEMIAEIKQRFPPQYHADVVTEILNVVLEKSAKDVASVAKSMMHLINTNTIAADNFLAGLKEVLEFAPDLHIDIPMLYEYLGQFIAPQIGKKHITFVQILRHCETIISSNHGHLLLKAIIRKMKDNMGPSFAKSKWQESGLQFKEWMNEDQVPKWIEDNKFEFLEGAKACEEMKKILSPAETQSNLLQLMNTDENCECIKGWIQDNLGDSSKEDWFMRALIQAICEHALFGAEGRDVPHFSQDRMNKYSRLINEFGESQQAREASCLFGIQQLIHRLEHPKGLSLEIFQYLHEQYIISAEGFIAWEESDLEPEGKGVMMKALTSFFTNIKEADNEDSCSED